MTFLSRIHSPAASLAVLLLLGACARTEIVPEDGPQPGMGEITSPPASAYPAYPSPASGTVHVVQAGEGLYSIARRYGLSYQTLAAWNGIPPPYTIYPGQQLKLAPGSSVVSAPVVVQPAPSAPVTGGANYYTVQRGDTLYSIARRYGRNYQEIAAWNGIAPPYSLSAGQRLVVSASSGYTPAPAYTPAPKPVYTPAPAPAPVATAPVAAPATGGYTTVVEYVDFSQGPEPVIIAPPTGGGNVIYYTVQRGDTLNSVAQRYKQRAEDIAAWNRLQAPYNLGIGQSLLVSPPSSSLLSYAPPVMSQPATAAGRYTVQRGDTLYSIARRYGVTVQDLAALNNLPPSYQINVGQVLRIGSSPLAASTTAQPKGLRVQSLPATSRPVSYKRIVHTVQPGENLSGIAQQYQQSPHQIAMWNGLASPYTVYPGQQLQIILP